MDIEGDNLEESQVNMSQSSDEEDKNDSSQAALCNTDYKTEITFIEENKDLFYPPNICPKCNKDSIRTNIFERKNILQPIGLRCINKKCKKRLNYRNFSFFKLHPKLPCSIIYEILKLSLLEKKMVKKSIIILLVNIKILLVI